MSLGNSSGEQMATEVDARLKAPGNDGEPSPWVEVKLFYGRRELERNESYYRVVWVPLGGPVEMSRYPGGRTSGTDKSAKVLREPHLQHDIFIHGKIFEDTEALWKAVAASVAECFSGSVAFDDFEWITETQAHDFTVEGMMIRQRVAVAIPISETDRTTVEVLYQNHTGTFRGRFGDEDVC